MELNQDDLAGVGATQRQIIASYLRRFPDTNVEALAVQFAFASMATFLREGIERRIRDVGFNLSQSRFKVVRMLYLSESRELPKQEIAAGLHVSGAYVTQLISALEADGWVERSVSESDRRAAIVRLTANGIERADILVPEVLNHMVGTWNVLTSTERAEVHRILGKILGDADGSSD